MIYPTTDFTADPANSAGPVSSMLILPLIKSTSLTITSALHVYYKSLRGMVVNLVQNCMMGIGDE